MELRELVGRVSIKVIHRGASAMKTLVVLEETIRREGVTDGSTWSVTFILAMQLRELAVLAVFQSKWIIEELLPWKP